MNKLQKAGFVDVQRGEELPFGIDEAARYPLFTPDLIALMRRVIPVERQATVARAVTYTARKPHLGTGD